VNIPPIDRGQADKFLQLLGKNPATARLRAFPHRLNPDRFDAKTNPNGIRARAGTYDLSRASLWQHEGRGLYLVVNDGGDRDDAITGCVAFWVEWDNRPVEWQLQGWREFDLGEPSITVTTGGKSAHLYWVLDKPISPERWRPIQHALISVTKADPVNKNPSRVMRLPGAYYLGPDGKASGQSKIHASNDRRYTVEEVEGWLTDQPAAAPARPIPAGSLSPVELPPRPADALKKALLKLPKIMHGAGQYQTLVDLAMRLHVEIGAAAAEQLLAETCAPSITDLADYFKGTPNKIHRGSIWAHLRDEWGIDIRRHDLKKDHIPDATKKVKHGPQKEPAGEWWDEEAAEANNPSSGPTALPLLSLDEVRDQLQYAVQCGASRQDLEAERIRLSEASGIPAGTLRDLLQAIQRDDESGLQVQQETQRIIRAAERAGGNARIRLDQLLPPRLADALRVRTQFLPADGMATCMAFLVSVSGVVKLGTELIASYAASYRVPLNLYGALVARSGAKKSPLSRLLVIEPTHALALDLARQQSRAMSDWTEQNKGLKPSERTEEPRAAYISVSDATAEALTQQLQIHEDRGLGLLLHRDELAGLFGNLNQYRSGRGSDSEQLLEAYDGSGFRSLRVAASNGGRSYNRCHLSIWGTIQPAVLQALVTDGDASGLWARYLFIPLPEVVVRVADDESPEQIAACDAAASFMAAACDHVYRLPRTSLTMDSDARRAFMDYEETAQGLALKACLPAHGALMGKAPGKVLRVAGLLHLLWCWELGGSHETPVGLGVVERAIVLVDQINSWTLGIHEAAADAGEASDLMRMVHRLAEATGKAITWRDVAQRLSRVQRKAIDSGAAGSAVEALAGMGLGQVERTSRGAWTYQATNAMP
jgi:hypothetical protein